MISPRSILTLVAVALCAAGCGKKEPAASAPAADPAAPPAPSAAAPAAPAAPASTADAPRVVEITANDLMKFNLTRIEATAGETLRVRLRNIGVQPKAAMGHNFVLLHAGVDVNAFILACATAGPTKDYFPADRAAEVIAYTKLIGPRETDEVTFTVPAAPGEYAYVCTFPGHVALGMKGVLVVK